MYSQKSFIENHKFLEKSNSFLDKDSMYNQSHLVGVFPITNIPYLYNRRFNLKFNGGNSTHSDGNNNQPISLKQLDNYGIPAGIITFNPINKIHGFYKNEIKKKNVESDLIDEKLFDNLFNNITITSKKNKTIKNKK